MTLKNRFLALVWQLKIAIIILVLEASILALVSSSFLINIAYSPKSIPTLVALFAIFIGATLLLFFVARQLTFKKRWARSAAFFWQLIQLAVAWNSFTGQWANYYIGGYLVITSLATSYFLFTKPVVEATQEKIDRE